MIIVVIVIIIIIVITMIIMIIMIIFYGLSVEDEAVNRLNNFVLEDKGVL